MKLLSCFLFLSSVLFGQTGTTGTGTSNTNCPTGCTITTGGTGQILSGVTNPTNHPPGTLGASVVYSPNGPLNVKAFGATGDGVTNDTTAIQNCINAVEAAGGGTVLFPPGKYLHTGLTITATPQAYVSFQGSSGYNNTQIYCTGSAATALSVQNDNYASFSNMAITSDGTCTHGMVIYSPAGTGSNSSNVLLQNLQIGNFTGNGLTIGKVTDQSADDVNLKQVFIYSTAKGIYIAGNNSGNVFADGLQVTTSTVGLEYLGATGLMGFPVTITGGSFSGNGTDLLIDNPMSLTLNGFLSEGIASSSSGTLLQVGSATPSGNSSIYTRVTMNGVIAAHSTSFASNQSMALYAPVQMAIGQSRIGVGSILMSGKGGSTQSTLKIDNSTLIPVSGLPWTWDAGNATNWAVSVRHSSTSDTSGTSTALVDTDYMYTSGATTLTSADYKWSNNAATQSNTNFFVNSTYNDLLNGSPQYGLGWSNLTFPGGGGQVVQLSGFWGLLLADNGIPVASTAQGQWIIGKNCANPLGGGTYTIKDCTTTTGATRETIALGAADTAKTVTQTNQGVSQAMGLISVPVLTVNLPTCAASTGPATRASVSDATAPAIGVVLTGGGTVFANVHCSLTTGTYLVDGL